MSFRRLALFASRRNLLCLHQKQIPRFARDDKLRDFFSSLLGGVFFSEATWVAFTHFGWQSQVHELPATSKSTRSSSPLQREPPSLRMIRRNFLPSGLRQR